MVTISQVTEFIAQLGGLAIFAGILATIAAFVYRWYVREVVPRGLALLVGLSGVAVYLNTTTALGQVIGGSGAPTEIEVALFNIAAFLVGAGGATAGRLAGDRFGTDLFLGEGRTDVDEDVSRLVQSVGRVIAVELPTDIDDVVGYDPVPTETKEMLAGKTFLFPRRLTVTELRDRLISRLKTDYGVGHVDIELADDGAVEYLALGSRAAGIGPTLPPATNAVAIRADPAFAASAGDLVQVWETDPMRRVLTAELRGVAEDTVTVAIDAGDTQKIDPTTEYRLVTLPVEDRPDREFASLLRAADETFSSVTVEAGSPLHGLPIGALDLAVVAVKPEDRTQTALPDLSTVLAPGDIVFAIARPDALRRLRAAATPLDPSLVSTPSAPRTGQDRSATDETDTAAEPDPDPAAAESSLSATDADPVDATAPDDEQTGEQSASDPDLTTEDDDAETGSFDPPAAEGADDIDDTEEETASAGGDSSFAQLKAEFESGEADWSDESANGDQSADAENMSESDDKSDGGLGDALVDAGEDLGEPAVDSDDTDPEPDDLDGFDFGDEDTDGDGLADDDSLDFDAGGTSDEESGDDLDSLSVDDDDEDDLSSLSFDEEESEGLSFDDDEETDSEETDDDNDDDEEADDGDDEEDDDEDSGSGGGASSFQQLKEEFESGDADWEDDVSDSPGGDMRLDE